NDGFRLFFNEVLATSKVFWDDMEDRTQRHIGCLDGRVRRVAHESNTFVPQRRLEERNRVGRGSKISEHDDSGKRGDNHRADKAVTDEGTTAESRLFVSEAEDFDRCGAGLI